MHGGPSRENAFAAYGLLLVCVVLAWAACMAGAGIWPFGPATLAPIDNVQQIAPDFGAITRILDGRESLMWNYASGGAVRNFIATCSHNVISPTTWFAWLMPWDDIWQALSWQVLFQLMAAALTCCLYLRHRFLATPWLIQVGLAFSYAFSHYFLTKYLCLIFLNIYAVFPLFLMALDALLRRGRMSGFVALMAAMMGVAGYFAWMFGLFAVVYALADRHPRRLWGRRVVMARLAFGTALAMALSCFMWLPDVMHMAHSSRAGEISLIKLVQGLFYPDEVTFWTLLPLACTCLLMAASGRRLKAILCSREGMTAAVLCLCLLFLPASFVWCMGVPVGFMSRFSFMVSMLLCCMACHATGGARTIAWLKRYGVLLLVMGGLMGIGYRFLRFEPALRCAALWGFGTGAAAVIVMCLLRHRPGWLLTACMVCHVAVFFCFYNNHLRYALQYIELDPARVRNDVRLMQLTGRLPMAPGDRIKCVDNSLMENNGGYTGFNRFSNNTQSSTKNQREALDSLGYMAWWTRQMDVGGTILSDSFMGCRYLVSGSPSLEGVAACLHAEPGFYVYANPFYWGVGALVSCADMTSTSDHASSLHHQQALYHLLAGKDASALFIYQDKPSDGAWRYRQYGVNESLFGCSIFPGIRDLVRHSSSRLLLQFSPNGDAPCCHVADPDSLSALQERQKGAVEVVREAGDGLDLKIHPKPGRDMLLVPLLYLDGYRATCDGSPLEVVEAMGFVGIRLPEGGRDGSIVNLSFSQPYKKAGGIISICAGLICLLLVTSRKTARKADGLLCWAGGVSLVSCAVLLAGIIFWTLSWCAAFIAFRL